MGLQPCRWGRKGQGRLSQSCKFPKMTCAHGYHKISSKAELEGQAGHTGRTGTLPQPPTTSPSQAFQKNSPHIVGEPPCNGGGDAPRIMQRAGRISGTWQYRGDPGCTALYNQAGGTLAYFGGHPPRRGLSQSCKGGGCVHSGFLCKDMQTSRALAVQGGQAVLTRTTRQVGLAYFGGHPPKTTAPTTPPPPLPPSGLP